MSNNAPSKNFLRDHVRQAVREYFERLEGMHASGIYELVLAEVERPLLEIVMEHAKGNQSKAAEWLGLNRGTLRKLLSKYNIG